MFVSQKENFQNGPFRNLKHCIKSPQNNVNWKWQKVRGWDWSIFFFCNVRSQWLQHCKKKKKKKPQVYFHFLFNMKKWRKYFVIFPVDLSISPVDYEILYIHVFFRDAQWKLNHLSVAKIYAIFQHCIKFYKF